MYGETIKLFGWDTHVTMYGICFAIGIVVCLVLLLKFTKIKGMTPQAQNFFYFTGIGSIIVGYFFAALFQATYDYIENPSGGFNLFNSGITFLGGLIGGVGAFLAIYYGLGRKKYKDQFPILFEFAPVGITIAHFFGRIGCFFAGCCYGQHTDSWIGIFFPKGGSNNHMNPADDLGTVLPTQLFEALFLLALFVLLTYFFFKDIHINMATYLGAYGIWRFVLEFFRADDRGALIGVLTPSQFWSLLMVVAAIGLIVLRICLKKFKNYDLWV